MNKSIKEKYEEKLRKIQYRNSKKQLQMLLKKERNKYNVQPKFETNKIIAIYLFALLNTIIVYSMIAMWKFSDLSYLGVLISDIAAQVIIYAIYCMKAYHGKKQEEDMKFKREQMGGSHEENEYNTVSNGSDETVG